MKQIEKIRNLIVDDRLDEALNQLIPLVKEDSKIYNEILHHKAKLSELNKNNSLDLISSEEALRIKSKIVFATLNQLSKLELKNEISLSESIGNGQVIKNFSRFPISLKIYLIVTTFLSVCLLGIGLISYFSLSTEMESNVADKTAMRFNLNTIELRNKYVKGKEPLLFQHGELFKSQKKSFLIKVPPDTSYEYLLAVSKDTKANFSYLPKNQLVGDIVITKSGNNQYQIGKIMNNSNSQKEVRLIVEMIDGASQYIMEVFATSQ